MTVLLSHLLFILGLVLAALSLPSSAFGAAPAGALWMIGAIGLWRHGWSTMHLLRGLWYRHRRFPQLRRTADAVPDGAIGHAFLVVTSFRIDAETTAAAYRAAFAAAAAAPGGATVVASLVEIGDERLVRALLRRLHGERPPFRLVVVRIAGTGKRDAIAHALRAVAGLSPGPADTVSLIDGDSLVPRNLVRRCAPLLLADPGAGALTTDEAARVEGAPIFRHWYALRFAQRHVLMSSHGLAGRVLTLTGRMSMIRAPLACNPGFIAQIEDDRIRHWRLGEIRMLTGDDKSSWFWLLRHGHRMLYVPDVVVETIERPPVPSFLRSAGLLMTRWFGNMLRTNGRALALGPGRIGLFTWWSVLDQRLSMWTCLSGLVLALVGTIVAGPWTFLLYALWLAGSRYVAVLTLLAVRPNVSLAYVPLLVFNQIFGSAIKIAVFFRLDRQKWTRQDTRLADASGRWAGRWRSLSSNVMTGAALCAFAAVLAVTAGHLGAPPADAILAETSR